MEHLTREIGPALKRIGMHYPGDNESFSLASAQNWVRHLNRLNVNWLALRSPSSRAIPEDFIRRLTSQGIHLIIQFGLKPDNTLVLSEVRTLLEVYGKWGVEYACLIEQPNMKHSWGDELWVKNNIVEEHLNIFLQFSQICVENNIHPVFSPLFPAGDYWDLAFLEDSFKIIREKASPQILDSLVIAAYGWHFGHPLDWGAGAKAHWPLVAPFIKYSGQDQRGFRTYEWYSEICQKVFSEKKPMIILEAGLPGNEQEPGGAQATVWSLEFEQLHKLLTGENVYDDQGDGQLFPPIGQEVLVCFFPEIATRQEKFQNPAISLADSDEAINSAFNQQKDIPSEDNHHRPAYPYSRYIYIDQPLRSQTPNILQHLDSYIKDHKPYIGFSLADGSKSPYMLAIAEDKQRFADQHQAILSAANIVKVVSLAELNSLEI